MKKYDLALTDFAKSLKINPEYITAYVNRAFVYEEINDFQKALNDAVKAKELGYKGIEKFIHKMEEKVKGKQIKNWFSCLRLWRREIIMMVLVTLQ